MRRSMRHRLTVATVLLAVATSAAACGSDETTAPTTSDTTPEATPDSTADTTPDAVPDTTPDAAPDVTTIDITVAAGEITPSGEGVDVALGEEVDLVVTADAPGEIHVHSDPEEEFAYEGTGEPETFTLTIDRPGQVEVESHTLDKLIVKLVVS